MNSLEQVTAQLMMVTKQLSTHLDSLEQILPAPARGRLYRDAGLIRFELERPISLQEVENAYIAHVLAYVDNNKTQAAAVLGIDASTLYRKLDRLQGSNGTP